MKISSLAPTLLFLLFVDAHSHGHHGPHYHKDDHEHEHGLRRFLPRSNPNAPNFHAAGKDWKDRKAFIDSGSRCHYREPDAHTKEETNKKLALRKKKNIKARNERSHSGGLRGLQEQGPYIIDVYFHIIHKQSGEGNVSDEVVWKQMTILNQGFSGESTEYGQCGGVGLPMTDTNIRFNLKQITRTANDAWYNLDVQANENAVKGNLRQGDCSDLNIYTGKTTYLGWATFPGGCAVYQSDDGVVLLTSSLPDQGSGTYDQGDTATHEVGHWLGLYHTFQGGCGGNGDQVDDTPSEETPAYGCPTNQDTCSSPGADPVHNFMDYTDDCCMFRFSPGQIERMELMGQEYRGFLSSPPPPPTPPTSAPTPSPVDIPPPPTPCNGIDVTLDLTTDNYGEETSWNVVDNDGIVHYSRNELYYGDAQNYIESMCLTGPGPFTFTIFDSYDDGICCGYGNGNYKLSLDGIVVHEGGNFGSQDSYTISVESPNQYWAICGRSGRCTETDDIFSANVRHEVRCCSDTLIEGWVKRNGCNVWAESQFGVDGTCYHEKNHNEASSICSSFGGRLCTKSELGDSCTRGTGCSHDSDLIWSSTIQEGYVVCGRGTDISLTQCSEGSTELAPVDSLHEVRCCSDVALSGWTKNGGCSVWGQSKFGADGLCYALKTFNEAHMICQQHQGRLCTVAELEDSCTRW
eukprot:CAMPEP_0183297908 /NCGR_PEP_ID=MMETSP0160_2-20130417/5065_1 /TAXON_ID=2839 ORGANISM="Odontella Sinensis, Strain Grunow 1884" /NCGR_SAMPLE_ID=MMETSP0160_2 /ASSEMBLY_ACC=CAM_ASM_000250 /LENGTH=688 /DNA_ID=CAMNT_0025459809 /DNA_START=37 /DNA_END=2100 /DNA_ORIENTATION=+